MTAPENFLRVIISLEGYELDREVEELDSLQEAIESVAVSIWEQRLAEVYDPEIDGTEAEFRAYAYPDTKLARVQLVAKEVVP